MHSLAARLTGLFGHAEGETSRSRAGRTGATSAHIMVPRIVFGVTAACLTIFGLLMIYSASSIAGLTDDSIDNNPAYYLVRQAKLALIGTVVATLLAYIDYHKWRDKPLARAWIAVLILLVLVFTPLAGHDEYGASRWIGAFGFTLQPSELAKIMLVLVGANLAERYFAEGSIDGATFAKLLVGGVGLPLFLILIQPDKGTVGVVLITLLVMSYISGVSGTIIAGLVGAVVVGVLVYALKDDYSRARILTMFDPFSVEFDGGYQLTRGFFAFGTGGLQGIGLGMSRQKYNYLPMAHTDFIFAIIGEELGFLGAAGMVLAFGVLLWSGLKIAQNAPDLFGRLIAAGFTSLFIIQLLLNLAGVLGIVPLSGKPVPFVSYGGSSILSSLFMVGLVISVSMRSSLPETSHDRRRAQMQLAGEDSQRTSLRTLEGSTAGAPRVRSARLLTRANEGAIVRDDLGARAQRSRWQVHEGGAGDSSERTTEPGTQQHMRSAALVGRAQLDARGHKRVDLGPSAAERLRGSRSGRNRS